MAESCIIDLKEIETAAGERRFALAFLRALYRRQQKNREPVHLILDEADMWAPQQIRDKEGDSNKLFAIVERIVRRGRVDGFIPWQITQRPAELSNSVLSMAEGLIAMRLTLPHDRNALDAWIKGQADLETGKRIKGQLPTLQLGEGIVWLPGHDLLREVKFPLKQTYDSSRSPKRGEVATRHTLKPLDIDALKTQLAAIEQEVAASDPAKLKAEVARLTRELKAAQKHPAAAPAVDVEAIRQKAWEEGNAAAWEQAYEAGVDEGAQRTLDALKSAVGAIELPKIAPPKRPQAAIAAPRPAPAAPHKRDVAPVGVSHVRPKPSPAAAPSGDLTGPQTRILEALAFWEALGFEAPSRVQVAAGAGLSPTSSNFSNLLGALKTRELIDYPRPGFVAFTDAGRALAPPAADTSARQRLGAILTGPQLRIVDALPRNGSGISRTDLAEAVGLSPSSSNFSNLLGGLRTLGVVDYPIQGHVSIESWVWP